MSEWNTDPYDTGTPKYSTAAGIYDALQALVQTEEMGILSEIGMDVSWENQGYYYYDKGQKLLEEFEKLSEYGEKLWLLDLAILQTDKGEVHDTVYQALHNDDLAKRTGFKKIFVDNVLNGSSTRYQSVTEAWEAALAEENRFDFSAMAATLTAVLREFGVTADITQYGVFCNRYYGKVMGLKLECETKLITEARAHLTAYDDFLYGLRVNQALHEAQERSYQQRVAQLQASYQAALGQLLALAEQKGLAGELAEGMKMLGGGGVWPTSQI